MTLARITIKNDQLRKAADDLKEIRGGMKQALRLAIWDTTKQIRTDTSKRIRDKVNIKKKDIDPKINLQRPTVSGERLVGKMVFKSSERLPLSYFGAKQVGKVVKYKIDKAGQKTTAKDLFVPPTLYEQVFQRVPGKKQKRVKKQKRSMRIKAKRKTQWMWPQLPIRRALGVSPYGVLKKNNMVEPIAEAGTEFMQNNVTRRVNFLILKQQGKLSWQLNQS